MTRTNPTADTVLLCGRDHEEYGRVAVVPVSAHTACAISAGADAEFAQRTQKRHANEDALLVIEDARHTVICVADAHFGREASERLMERLAAELAPVPQNPEQLDAVLGRIAESKTRDDYLSESTLAICILDRLFRQAFGVSYGDSSIVHVAPGDVPQRENAQTSQFVTLAVPRTLAPRHAQRFAFSSAQGDLVLVFTDGVDECCYRDPDRSITPEVLHALLARTGHEPEAAAREIAALALAGVAGNPGGQDNVALVATRV